MNRVQLNVDIGLVRSELGLQLVQQSGLVVIHATSRRKATMTEDDDEKAKKEVVGRANIYICE